MRIISAAVRFNMLNESMRHMRVEGNERSVTRQY